MANEMTLEEQFAQAEKRQGLGGAIFKFEEGDNKIRILSIHLLHPLLTHFIGQKPFVCYGADEGCRYHGEHAPVDNNGNPEKGSTKFLAYILNTKDKEPIIQRADLVYTIVKKVMALKKDEDYTFESFPMPYDLKIKYDKNQAGAAMYEIVPSPKKEEVSEEILAKLATQKPLAKVVEEAMQRAENADE